MSNVLSLPSPEMYRPEFEDAYELEYQQTTARADGLCDKVILNGEFREFPMLKKTDSARKITKQYEETAPSGVSAGKRRVTSDPYVSPLIFDRVDEKKFGTLGSQIPSSIANQRAEAARNMDATIVGVAGQVGGLLGQAIEIDANGQLTYPAFDTTYVIPANYTKATPASGSNVGMSYEKLIHLKTKLGKLNVRSQDNTTNNPAPFGLLIGYSQIEDLLHDPKIENRDHAAALIEQVAEGVIVDILGFSVRAIDDDVLPIDGSGLRTCIAFAKNAVKFGCNDMLTHELDRLPTKTHAIQSTLYWDWGLGRIWDQGVWQVPCLEV